MAKKENLEEKKDMFKKAEYHPYEDYNYKYFCSKCSRYEKCRQMNPECECSKVTYC